MVENPLATATLVWIINVFNPRNPTALRRWVRAHAGPAITDDDVLNALVLVVHEAVMTAGATTDPSDPVAVELWRGPDELRFLVACAAMLPMVSRTDLPDDPRMRALWMSQQINSEIVVDVTDADKGSRILVTFRTGRWS